MRFVVAVLAGMLLAGMLLTGCSSVVAGRPVALDIEQLDRERIVAYFERGNAAADEGTEAQQRFFAETQHPDFESDLCDLGGHTLTFEPTLSTLQPDDDWTPDDGDTPRGRVYVVAVTVTVQQDRTVLGTQIGSVHVVVLEEEPYGFAPCPG
jgi:hypothetical protein